MADSNNDTKPGTANASRKFSKMSAGEKIVFIGQFVIFLVTFGFAYPNLLSPD